MSLARPGPVLLQRRIHRDASGRGTAQRVGDLDDKVRWPRARAHCTRRSCGCGRRTRRCTPRRTALRSASPAPRCTPRSLAAEGSRPSQPWKVEGLEDMVGGWVVLLFSQLGGIAKW